MKLWKRNGKKRQTELNESLEVNFNFVLMENGE